MAIADRPDKVPAPPGNGTDTPGRWPPKHNAFPDGVVPDVVKYGRGHVAETTGAVLLAKHLAGTYRIPREANGETLAPPEQLYPVYRPRGDVRGGDTGNVLTYEPELCTGNARRPGEHRHVIRPDVDNG